MLTYDFVLDAFSDYFSQDKDCEIVKTSRGYAILLWDDYEWDEVYHCENEKDLWDQLLLVYKSYLEYILPYNKDSGINVIADASDPSNTVCIIKPIIVTEAKEKDIQAKLNAIRNKYPAHQAM